MKLIRKIMPCEVYDIERIESYLMDQESKGYKIHHHGFLFTYFEKCEAKDVKYRLSFGVQKENDDELLVDLYEKEGYEFICKIGGRFVFRNTNLHAIEPENDYSIQEQIYKDYLHAIILTVVPYLLAFMIIVKPFDRTMLIDEAIIGSTVFGYGWIIYFLLFVLTIFLMTIQAIRLYLNAKSKKEMNHHKPYFFSRIIIYIKKCIHLTLTVFILFAFVSTFSKNRNNPMVEYTKEIPFMSAAEIMEGRYDSYSDIQVRDFFSESEKILPTNYLDETTTFFTPKNLYLNEYKSFEKEGQEDIRLFYELEYHECRNELIAKEFYQELILDVKRRDKIVSETKLKQNFDEITCFYDQYRNNDLVEVVVVRKDNYVVKIYLTMYQFGVDLDVKEDLEKILTSLILK